MAAADEEGWLAMALRAAAAAGSTLKDVRSMRWQALESSHGRYMAGAAPGTWQRAAAQEDAIGALEEVLAAVKVASGKEGIMDIVSAKCWLRSFGPRGHKAASRISTLSSRRNRRAHPVAQQLIAEVQMLGAEAEGSDGNVGGKGKEDGITEPEGEVCEDVPAHHDTELKRVPATIQELRDKVAALEAQLNEAVGKASELEEKLDAEAEKAVNGVGALEAKLAGEKEQLAEAVGKVSELETKLAAEAKQVAEAMIKVTEWERRVSTAEEEAATLKEEKAQKLGVFKHSAGRAMLAQGNRGGKSRGQCQNDIVQVIPILNQGRKVAPAELRQRILGPEAPT